MLADGPKERRNELQPSFFAFSMSSWYLGKPHELASSHCKRACIALATPTAMMRDENNLFQKSGVSSMESLTRFMPKKENGQRDFAHWLQFDRPSSGAHCQVDTATPFLKTSIRT